MDGEDAGPSVGLAEPMKQESAANLRKPMNPEIFLCRISDLGVEPMQGRPPLEGARTFGAECREHAHDRAFGRKQLAAIWDARHGRPPG